MTRVQFLNDLYRRLGALEKAQAEEWLVYYAEMLADRMEEGMTEEEAVGSMEDLDTIARRILQEAGLPPEAMTDPDAPVTPPVYPDPPAGGGGKRAYRPPRDRDRTIIRVLWVVAAVAVVFTGVGWLARAFGYRQTAMSSVTYYTEESPVPDLVVQGPAFYQGDGYSRYEGSDRHRRHGGRARHRPRYRQRILLRPLERRDVHRVADGERGRGDAEHYPHRLAHRLCQCRIG